MSHILLSVALVCAALSSLVEAGIFLKVKDPLIVQGATWLYSNSTAITQVALDVPANKFSRSIVPLDNVPLPDINGATGVLYNRDESCSSSANQQPIPLPFYSVDPKDTKIPKIALIKKQGGNCSMAEKIRNAEIEGAIGAIVYDTMASGDDHRSKAGVPPESGIKIPAYYVDNSVGVELYHQLEKMAGVPIHQMPVNDGSNLTTRISVRVSLMPADNLKPVAWEYTLLVMIVILGTSIFFSVIMHIYIWKKGQRLQSVVERHRAPITDSLPMGKSLLTIAKLHEFPTRTIDVLPDEEERKKVEDVLSDEKQRGSLMNTTATSPSASNAINRKPLFGNKKLLKKSSLASVAIKMEAPVNSMCVVCLEAFKIGDQVRELPCHHEYHCNCIDPWLTSKSGECPLCKFDCSVDTKAEKTNQGSDDLIAAPIASGLRDMFLGLYSRFKANRQKRIGRVNNHPNTQAPQAQSSRQSITSTDTKEPDSPGLRAALRAVEASVEVMQQQQECEQLTAMEAQQMAYAAATTGNGDNIESISIIDEPLTPLHPHERALAEQLPRISIDSRHTSVSEDAFPRASIATLDYPPTIETHTSIHLPAASNGGFLPDIDVSSISLCSIDLDNMTYEDEHQNGGNSFP